MAATFSASRKSLSKRTAPSGGATPARERKPTQRYKPVNYLKPTEAKNEKKPRQPRQLIQPIPATEPPAVLPAIQIIDPRTPVPKDNPLRTIKHPLNKKYRLPSSYKLLRKVSDDISKDITQSIKTFKFDFYNDDRYAFTIYQKMEQMKERIDNNINGPNSWTNEIYAYDLTKEQYQNLNYIHKPTLQEIKDNKYVGGKVSNDKNTYQVLKSIIDKTLSNRIDENLTWMVENHRAIILDMLVYRFNKSQSLSTFWNDLKAITRLIKICLGDEHELYYKMSMITTDFHMGIILSQEGINRLNKYEQQTFLPFGMLLDMTEEMLDTFIKAFSDNSTDAYKFHTYTIIMMSYLYTPPVRSELNNMKITHTLENLDKKTNYVYVPENGLIMYVFNKAHKGHSPIRYKVGWFNNPNDINPLAYKLSDFVRESIALYPREYYITQVNNMNAPAKSNMEKYLAAMFQGHRLGVNMFRSSFITWLHSNNASANILTDVSLKMRNSIIAQYKNYKKALLPTDIIRIKQEPRDDNEGPITIQENTPANTPANMRQAVIPQPRAPAQGYKDPRNLAYKAQQRYIQKIGKDAYNKYQHNYYEENKKEISIKKAVRRVNDLPEGKINPYDIPIFHKSSKNDIKVPIMENINIPQYSCPQSKYYAKRIVNDKEFYEQERARLRIYKSIKYNTDPEYRQKELKRARERYYKKKAEQANKQEVSI
ncbi:hypothetical protein GUITHDRAFT_145933 [Guillardia theta CCMP2712]|uniref:Uncharacterized protein n=1 Tax=Guillardia theta (strain CCMP2712) TaxID=905079 RepID=L1IJG9_GUITC|nr:hypothetical protein GUITHDRAFT_145933 [Guillardia theta CCMP2712]EKX36252.1 hypothetical protein GUITHDRAFT_145933 [Guillardia theta CCMP2712]|eukprot:XP_005823232.1 hypothetical protein GUITHDRAFT_145933 [Guillardia theta CCMP2712]